MLTELTAGPITGGDYKALEQLVGPEQLGVIATRELLDWRTAPGHVSAPDEEHRENARRLWAQVGAHLHNPR